ncbi:MAG: UDP-N-acetylmuramoyl-L-alanine--D-glutamate ligase [Bacteroidales bacterium]|nr:UDP-N-acetylmuramoyl-L-alanine--D-glutamate ligase [Bacteroidales bacterium]
MGNFVFHIGMVELASYWKAACSPKVFIRPHALNKTQIAWWKKLYFHGLGEFFYLNGIVAGEDDFMQLVAEGTAVKSATNDLNATKALVPVGGGKDSIVTLELLKTAGLEIIPFMLNPREASERTVGIAGFSTDNSIVIQRSLDQQLLELNKQGFLNGHTPFSALLAFCSALAAVASGAKYIALSNESSASQSTVPGTNINHQYSKSFEFEKDFVGYARKYLHPGLAYFSFLRPVNELQIAWLFSGFPQHFDSFRSCNVGSKTDSWCGSCPKCLFTYSILSPFVPPEELQSIFGKDLFADEGLLPVFDELTGKAAIKPFECVGTPGEVQAALAKTIRDFEGKPLPVLLKHFLTTVPPATMETLLNSFEEENFLPEAFTQILKDALFRKQKTAFRDFLENVLDGNNKVLLLGFGREGRSSYRLLRTYFPELEIGIADRMQSLEGSKELAKDKFLIFHLGEGYKNAIGKYNFVFKSPGVSLSDFPPFDESKISSQTDLFLRFYRNQTIGVTGTKGKSTTASLVVHLLKEAGRKAVLLGNIGVPAFDLIDKIEGETVVVFELSAHQLEYLHSSPRVAVLLNVFPEHLDYFGSFEKYRAAKLNIFKHQLPGDVTISEKTIQYEELQAPFDLTLLPLKGAHNQKNILAALQAVAVFGVDPKEGLSNLKSFRPLPHRLEFVGNFGGIQFYNDSISTVPESAIAAVETLEQVKSLILGGHDRGIDYSGLVGYLSNCDIATIVFLGKAGETMRNLFEREENLHANLFTVNNLEEAMNVVKANSRQGGICLLSPAAASYDQYHNFEHRGDTYKALVRKMFA